MKKYAVTTHAIDRAIERLDKPKTQVKKNVSTWLADLMQTAVYQGSSGAGRIFDHYNTRTRLILAPNEDLVVTVYSMDEEQPVETGLTLAYNAIIEKARVVISRELTKARRQFTTEKRKLTLTEAELGVEIANLTLNKARAKNPNTQALIASRINELEIGRQAVAKQLQTVAERFEQMRAESEQFIGG